MTDDNQLRPRYPEEDIPGSAFAGCLWAVAIGAALAACVAAWWAVCALTDKCEAQMLPEFDLPTSSSDQQ